jgi:pyruvate formate lyase activating enzyme
MSKQSNNPSALTGIVLNIQRYCSHDGPGIRTTVFLKGCSLRCKWCSNPESIRPKPELAYDVSKCLGAKECGLCLKSPFPEGAFYVVDGADDKIRVNWDLATDCDEATVSLCPTDALYMFGKEMTVEEVLNEVEKDASFYRSSRRVLAAAGLRRRIAGRSPQSRHQYRDRNGGQRSLVLHGKGVAPRGYHAA